MEDAGRRQLRAWLGQQVRLPEYWELFMDSGIEDLGTAALLSTDTIVQIGIDKVGHQLKIMNEVRKLRMSEPKIRNEGTL